MDKISKHLYVGGAEIAQNEKWVLDNHIALVVGFHNVNYGANVVEQVQIVRCCVEDGSAGFLTKYFTEAHTHIAKAIAEQKNVLLHCAQGISRSFSAALLFAMHHCNMTLKVRFSKLLGS
jgi:hypothetical protein